MTLTPAERFAAAKRRAAQSKSEFATFSHQFDFELDPFQQSACTALESGKTVLVAAPTGAGKTVVGEFACHLALKAGAKCFYTTPIKALSNQKFADLCEMFGAENVGLLECWVVLQRFAAKLWGLAQNDFLLLVFLGFLA